MKNILQEFFILFAITFVQTKILESPISNVEKEVEFHKPWISDENEKDILEIAEMSSISRIKDIDKEITFRLYTKETGTKYQKLKINDIDRLNKSNFNPRRPTRFLSHGWRTEIGNSIKNKIRKAFLENEDCNLIMISWVKLSFQPYFVIKKNIEKMGKFIASFINFLETQGMNLNNTTLVGVSLGSHLVGITGYYTNRKVNNIIGLDPAWYLYNSCGLGCRISTESGKNVEIIHTNDDFLGYPTALGHLDFYPNGGSKQPGCILDALGLCSHNRALRYYLESLSTTRGFHGMKCHSYKHFQTGTCRGQTEVMGGVNLSFKQPGVYFLNTNAKKPYAKGKIREKAE